MSPTRTLLLCGSLALFANVIPTQQALAVALRPNKTTDDSVCDLTHHTNLYLGSKTLVPSVAQTKDKVDAYFRLAGEFVAGKHRGLARTGWLDTAKALATRLPTRPSSH